MNYGKVTALGTLICSVCCGPLWADGGSIPFRINGRPIEIFKPDQRALIAWNGQEEVLILSTNLQASEATKVLEVVPMPSEPKVTSSDLKVFNTAIEILNSKLPKPKELVSRGNSGGGGGAASAGGGEGEAAPPPVATITFHESIGATEVSVVHVLTPKGFIDWVEKYLKSQNVANPVIPDIMKKSVEDYLADGYGWFVFNVVSLDKTVKSKEAVQYRFKTDCLFYPMRISHTDEGDTNISLIILTKTDFDPFSIPGRAEGWLSVGNSFVATATAEETAKISRDCYALLPQGARIRVWTTAGKLDSFAQDIVVGPERTFTLQKEGGGPEYGPFPLSRDTRIRVGQETYVLLIQGDWPGKPFPLVLKQESPGTRQSDPFQLASGARVVLGKDTFIVKLGKAAVAKDPSAKADNHLAPTTGPAGK